MSVINISKRFSITVVLLALIAAIVFASQSVYIKTVFGEGPGENFGSSGWFTLFQYVGNDSITCGPNQSVGQIVLSEYSSQTPVTSAGSNWRVEVLDTNFSRIGSPTVMTNGENTSRSFCYQHSVDKIRVVVNESSNYYAHDSIPLGFITENPASEYHGKSYRGYVHLRSKSSSPQDLAPISPINGQIVRNTPTYRLDIRSISQLYNVTGLSKINLFIYRVGSGSPVASREVSAPGGAGIRNINATSLPDGFYGWHFFATLNGNTYNPDSRESVAPVPISAPTSVANFVIDSTPPETSVLLSQLSGVNVRLTNTVIDVTSGLVSTQIFFNRVLPSRQTAVSPSIITGAPTSARVINVDVAVAPGATYEYFAVTTDRAGNIATSTISTYVAGGIQSIAYLQSQGIRLSGSPYPAGSPINIFGDVRNVSLVPVVVPFENKFYYSWDNNTTWVEQSTVNRSGLGAGILLTDSAAFIPNRTGVIFFRHCVDTGEVINDNNETVIRKCSVSSGIRVTAGAGIQDSVPLTCNPGFEPDLVLNVCKLIVEPTTKPFLVSLNLRPNGGASPRDQYIRYQADVVNIGSFPADVPFRNQFYFSWDYGANWSPSNTFIHPSLSSGLSLTNSFYFRPLRIGDLYFRHCVDVDNNIDESNEELSRKCSGPSQILIRPRHILSANCIITTGNSTCDTTFTWNITGAPMPNIFNETSNRQYSTALIGTNERYAIEHGENRIVARNDTVPYPSSRTSVFGSCDLGAVWDPISEVCRSTIGANAMPFLVDPIISVVASSNLIRSGTTAGVKIEITGNGELTCKLTGVISNEILFNFTPDFVGIIQTIEFDYTTRPLFSAQIVNLECTGTNGNVTTGKARISVVGITQEI